MSSFKPQTTRRGFIKTTLGAASAIGFPTIIPATALGKGGKAAPSERITMGMIGCGNRGRVASMYADMPDVEVIALADPNANQIKKLKSHRSLKGKTFKETSDFRTFINDDIDAVHISTPDHWHAAPLLMAARAGKHVYVEKPLAISIEQCLACNEIVKEYSNLQVQYGTQNRSTAYVRPALELILNGHIGEVKDIFVWAPQGSSFGESPPSAVPDGFDMEMWLGPAPVSPYSKARCLPQHSPKGIYFIYDYAIGFIAGWGAHPMDQLQWYLDEIGIGIPEKVKATGTLPTTGLFDTITGWDTELLYSNGRQVRFSDHKAIQKHLPKHSRFKPEKHGTLFVGSEGWVYCSRNSIQASSREMLTKIKNPGSKRLVHSKGGHTRNFIDAIKGTTKTVSDLSSAIRSDISCHLCNLAIRNGGSVQWDHKKQTIVGNVAAAAGIHRPMRKPWDITKR